MKNVLGLGAAMLIGLMAVPAAAQNIPTNPNVSLRVGQSTIVHGARGRACGATAPSWAETAATLPSSQIGTFSDAGIGTRGSRSCGGNVPARAIRFKATKKGSEVVTIQGDPISITVQ
jgi:hypothetical protein